jgi:hypothetical protein
MKKLFANAVMMIMLLTGCSYTAENFTADYPISGKGAILKFSAADENKITVQTKFPQSDIQLHAIKHTKTEMLDSELHGCLCLGKPQCVLSSGLLCSPKTVVTYSDVACYSHHAFNNTFDNTEQNFFARRLHNDIGEYDTLNPTVGCPSRPDRADNGEYFKADFIKNKNGKILTYEIKPTKRTVVSNWHRITTLDSLFGAPEMPKDEQELARSDYRFKYILKHPVDVNAIFSQAVAVEYDSGMESLKIKSSPDALIKKMQSNGRNRYKTNIDNDGPECRNITFVNDGYNLNYSYSVDVSLCSIGSNMTKVTVGKANIVIKNAGETDLTKFGSVINEIAGFFK